MKKKLTSSEMGKKSWEVRKKKYGDSLISMMSKAGKKSVKNRPRNKNGRFVSKLDCTK